MGRENICVRMAWNWGSDDRFWGVPGWVVPGGVGYSCISGPLKCVLGYVGTCRSKDDGF